VVDFSKLRLPGSEGKPGEGTEPAPAEVASQGVSVGSESTPPNAKSSDGLGATSPTGSDSALGGGTGGPESAVGVGDTQRAGDAGVSGGAAGLRLRLPGMTSSPAVATVPAVSEEVSHKAGDEANVAEVPASVVRNVPSLPLPRPVSVPSPGVNDSLANVESVPVPVVETVDDASLESVPESGAALGQSSSIAPEASSVVISDEPEVVTHEPEVVRDVVNPLLEDDDDFLSAFPEDDDTFVDEAVEVGNEESLYPPREAVNPLLEDDDDEELISASEMAQQLGLKSGLTEFSDEEISEEDAEDFTGFDDQFQSLLDDDEEDELVIPSMAGRRFVDPTLTVETVSEPAEVLIPEVVTPPVAVPAPVASPTVESPKAPAPEWASVVVPARSAKSPEQLEASAAQRKADLRAKEAEAKQEREFSSDFIGDATKVVKVNPAGETRNEAGKERKRLVKAAPGGKLKTSELDFFKSLGTVRSEFSDGMVATELVTGPLAKKETGDGKKGRLEHLQRVLDSRNLYRASSAFRLDAKTVDTLSFLALFRYATHSHIARMFGETPLTSLRRLRKMRDAGMVTSKKLYSQHAIWFLTEAGVIVSGYDMKHITEAKLTPSMFPHQFTVNHVAANLMGGKLNVLNMPEFPVQNRRNVRDELVMGEQLTSELEILSSFAKIKLFEQSSTFRPKLLAMRDREFQRWSETPNREEVPTPEMIFGNEWMFTLFPPLAVGVAYHVPDLVVKRQRANDGTPRSIAVEIEINNKPTASYEKTLRAYADDNLIFGQVVWVCKTVGPAKKLEKVGRDLGMIQSGKLKIVPIWTNAGVFKGRDLWTI